ncbi:hypothetical protein B0H11DRAFT_1860223 [Mycena galericulata]|nr:hypothetical protein B0H11DRAFT_1860223 [Mycena galericulata]
MPVPVLLSGPRPICVRPPQPFRRRPSASDTYTSTDVLALNFVCTRASSARGILNCAVVSRDDLCPYFHVVTRPDYLPGHTVVRTNAGRDVAWVEWVPNAHGGGTYVELRHKGLQKQLVSAWLGVSRDASYRIMSAHDQTYVWAPRADSICLYQWNPKLREDVPQLLARIAKEDDLVTLQISLTAIEAGLLEMTVVCVVLFQSGFQID